MKFRLASPVRICVRAVVNELITTKRSKETTEVCARDGKHGEDGSSIVADTFCFAPPVRTCAGQGAKAVPKDYRRLHQVSLECDAPAQGTLLVSDNVARAIHANFSGKAGET